MPPEPTRDERARDFELLENDVLAALAHHQRWRDYVRRGALTRAAAEAAPSIGECPLTAWLETRMHERFRGLPRYLETLAAHRLFHESVDRVAEGRPDGTFAHAATVFKSCLDDWLTYARVGEES